MSDKSLTVELGIDAKARNLAFVRVGKFAAIIDRSPKSVRKLIHSGRLPAIRVGRDWLIPLEKGIASLKMGGTLDEEPRTGGANRG